MGALATLVLLGALFLYGYVEAQSPADVLRLDALRWKDPSCEDWDCNCAFNRQRGCCCAVNELHQLEDDSYVRIKVSWEKVYALNSRVNMVIDCYKVAFEASINRNIGIVISGSTESCFGPFNTNVPIPFNNVTLNVGNGFNPALSVFTACCPGSYAFSFTAYSAVDVKGRLYFKEQLMKNGAIVSSVMENNRDDWEDSGTQVVILDLVKGDQVYVELAAGRRLCGNLQNNHFTGYMIYPQV